MTEGHHQEWSLRLNLTQHGTTYQCLTREGWTDWELFLDFLGGGAWPFLVGGVICLVNSDNERDLSLLSLVGVVFWANTKQELKGLFRVFCLERMEVWGNNRSVMPFDVLGCTRATMIRATSFVVFAPRFTRGGHSS